MAVALRQLWDRTNVRVPAMMYPSDSLFAKHEREVRHTRLGDPLVGRFQEPIATLG